MDKDPVYGKNKCLRCGHGIRVVRMCGSKFKGGKCAHKHGLAEN